MTLLKNVYEDYTGHDLNFFFKFITSVRSAAVW